MSRTFWIQILLILGTVVIVARILTGRTQRTQALRALALLSLGAFAVLSILFPNVWSRIANLLGVGRGTDLILYALVLAFFGYVVTSLRRFRHLEHRYTKLARRIALSETPSPQASSPASSAPTSSPPGLAQAEDPTQPR